MPPHAMQPTAAQSAAEVVLLGHARDLDAIAAHPAAAAVRPLATRITAAARRVADRAHVSPVSDVSVRDTRDALLGAVAIVTLRVGLGHDPVLGQPIGEDGSRIEQQIATALTDIVQRVELIASTIALSQVRITAQVTTEAHERFSTPWEPPPAPPTPPPSAQRPASPPPGDPFSTITVFLIAAAIALALFLVARWTGALNSQSAAAPTTIISTWSKP